MLFHDYTVFILSPFGLHVMWVPCHHGMVHPQFADGEDGLQLWRVAANKLNKQPQTADKESASSLEVGCGSNNLLPQKIRLLQKFTVSLEFDRISK
jgi:hypothetical protein